jgi:hypothetical protein
MTDPRTPVTGPHRISVDPIPAGVTLDVSAYVTSVVLALIRDEAAALDEIAELDELSPHADSHTAHERDERVEELILRLSPALPVYGGQVLALAERLQQLAQPKAVPGQRGAA